MGWVVLGWQRVNLRPLGQFSSSLQVRHGKSDQLCGFSKTALLPAVVLVLACGCTGSLQGCMGHPRQQRG